MKSDGDKIDDGRSNQGSNYENKIYFIVSSWQIGNNLNWVSYEVKTCDIGLGSFDMATSEITSSDLCLKVTHSVNAESDNPVIWYHMILES